MFNEMMNFSLLIIAIPPWYYVRQHSHYWKLPYPIKLAPESEIVQQTEEMQEQFKRVHIEDACHRAAIQLLIYQIFIFQKLQPGCSMLVIVNTKAEALNLYRACEQHHEIDRLYLSFIHQHVSGASPSYIGGFKSEHMEQKILCCV